MVPRRGFYLLFTLFVLLFNLSAMPAQQEDGELFDKTGHRVIGEFLEFYYAVDDPDRLFGNPITDAFPDPLRQGIMIQYFERVRMDMDPSLPEGERVRLANLGLWLYDDAQRGLPVDLPDTNAMCRVFANGKNVCYGFLQLYDRYNGPILFGQPVSDVEYANDRLVQYFENVRLEWRNEMPDGQKVVLTEIGRIDFDRRIGDPRMLRPDPLSITSFQRDLLVRAFITRPLVTSGEQQTVYVITHDQFLGPWADVQVIVTLEYEDGRTDSRRLENLTGGDGFTSGEFTIYDVEPNKIIRVLVEASVVNGPTGKSMTWFRSWW